MIHSSIMESFQYIKNEHSYNIQFDKYATTLEKSCNISYCNSDRDQVKKLNKLLDQAIAAQQKLLLLKYELMNGLYGYKINQTITLDQLEQLQTSINSAIEKTNLQARAEELNNRALTLFNNKIKNLCQN